jgi:hypothetical protein
MEEARIAVTQKSDEVAIETPKVSGYSSLCQHFLSSHDCSIFMQSGLQLYTKSGFYDAKYVNYWISGKLNR